MRARKVREWMRESSNQRIGFDGWSQEHGGGSLKERELVQRIGQLSLKTN